jgi:hypothetical protein
MQSASQDAQVVIIPFILSPLPSRSQPFRQLGIGWLRHVCIHAYIEAYIIMYVEDLKPLTPRHRTLIRIFLDAALRAAL